MKIDYSLTVKINEGKEDEKRIEINGFGSGYRTIEGAVKMVRREINSALSTHIQTGKVVHDK